VSVSVNVSVNIQLDTGKRKVCSTQFPVCPTPHFSSPTGYWNVKRTEGASGTSPAEIPWLCGSEDSGQGPVRPVLQNIVYSSF
jgi:hypothetical protein